MLEPSACQRATVSCGACCGIFNLDLNTDARRRLLLERTRAFADVQFDQPATFVEFRRMREQTEETLARCNHETYVCPFYGYLPAGGSRRDSETPAEPPADTRTGCMIHPSRTGLEHSQNFSFYGASICQAYDCACKEKDEQQIYSRFLENNFTGELYGRLMGDVLLFSALEKVPHFPGFLRGRSKADEQRKHVLLEILQARLLTRASAGITSFDIKFRWFEDPEAELLHLMEPEEGPEMKRMRRSIRILLKKLA